MNMHWLKLLVHMAMYCSHDPSSSISLKIPSGELLEYELLNVLEFTPERKCMSVIVREKGGRERVMVYTKGADSTCYGEAGQRG